MPYSPPELFNLLFLMKAYLEFLSIHNKQTASPKKGQSAVPKQIIALYK